MRENRGQLIGSCPVVPDLAGLREILDRQINSVKMVQQGKQLGCIAYLGL